MNISNNDLYKNKYSLELLATNICKLRSRTILSTQIVDAEFCAKYILNDEFYEGFEEDYFCDFDYVLKKQPHISRSDLVYWIEATPGAHY